MQNKQSPCSLNSLWHWISTQVVVTGSFLRFLSISQVLSSILSATAYLLRLLPFLATPTSPQRTAPQACKQPPRIEKSCPSYHHSEVNSRQGVKCTNGGAKVHTPESAPVWHWVCPGVYQIWHQPPYEGQCMYPNKPQEPSPAIFALPLHQSESQRNQCVVCIIRNGHQKCVHVLAK